MSDVKFLPSSGAFFCFTGRCTFIRLSLMNKPLFYYRIISLPGPLLRHRWLLVSQQIYWVWRFCSEITKLYFRIFPRHFRELYGAYKLLYLFIPCIPHYLVFFSHNKLIISIRTHIDPLNYPTHLGFLGTGKKKLLLRIREVMSSGLDPDTGYADWGLLWFYSVPPGKCWDSTLN
jgi:hypothetical protein